jgi:hypothetical protein
MTFLLALFLGGFISSVLILLVRFERGVVALLAAAVCTIVLLLLARCVLLLAEIAPPVAREVQ